MEESRRVAAWRRRLRIAIYASLVVAIAIAKLTTGPRSTGLPQSDQPATSSAPFALSDPVPRMAIVYDLAGRGRVGFNELAWEGTQRAADALGADLTELTAKPGDTDADREAL
jgi:basic membrane protein A